MKAPKLERFQPLTKGEALEFYGKREITRIPNDVLQIADRARALQIDVNTLRAQLLSSTVRNAIISGIVAGLITASKYAAVAIVHLLLH
jgi:hypothetical protein